MVFLSFSTLLSDGILYRLRSTASFHPHNSWPLPDLIRRYKTSSIETACSNNLRINDHRNKTWSCITINAWYNRLMSPTEGIISYRRLLLISPVIVTYLRRAWMIGWWRKKNFLSVIANDFLNINIFLGRQVD